MIMDLKLNELSFLCFLKSQALLFKDLTDSDMQSSNPSLHLDKNADTQLTL